MNQTIQSIKKKKKKEKEKSTFCVPVSLLPISLLLLFFFFSFLFPYISNLESSFSNIFLTYHIHLNSYTILHTLHALFISFIHSLLIRVFFFFFHSFISKTHTTKYIHTIIIHLHGQKKKGKCRSRSLSPYSTAQRTPSRPSSPLLLLPLPLPLPLPLALALLLFLFNFLFLLPSPSISSHSITFPSLPFFLFFSLLFTLT